MISGNSNKDNRKQEGRSLSIWISRFFMAAGAGWILLLLLHEGPKIASQLTMDSVYWALASLVIGSLALSYNGYIFYKFIKGNHKACNIGLLSASYLFFSGQIVRHLPGRFWGIAYQINEMKKELPASTLIIINLDFMLANLGFTLLIPTVIISFYKFSWIVAAIILWAGILIFFGLMRYKWLTFFLKIIEPWLPRRMRTYISGYDDKLYVISDLIKICAAFCVQWIIYLMGWQLFTEIYPSLKSINIFILCATYSIAWSVGFLSMVTPAGLGIREVVFVFLSGSVGTSADTTFLAVFVRVWLLVIDLILFLLILPVKIEKKENQ